MYLVLCCMHGTVHYAAIWFQAAEHGDVLSQTWCIWHLPASFGGSWHATRCRGTTRRCRWTCTTAGNMSVYSDEWQSWEHAYHMAEVQQGTRRGCGGTCWCRCRPGAKARSENTGSTICLSRPTASTQIIPSSFTSLPAGRRQKWRPQIPLLEHKHHGHQFDPPAGKPPGRYPLRLEKPGYKKDGTRISFKKHPQEEGPNLNLTQTQPATVGGGSLPQQLKSMTLRDDQRHRGSSPFHSTPADELAEVSEIQSVGESYTINRVELSDDPHNPATRIEITLQRHPKGILWLQVCVWTWERPSKIWWWPWLLYHHGIS